MSEEFLYLEKEFGLNQEFYDKLNKLSLEQIYKLLSHNRDIVFHPEVGIICGEFYYAFIDKKLIDIFTYCVKAKVK